MKALSRALVSDVTIKAADGQTLTCNGEPATGGVLRLAESGRRADRVTTHRRPLTARWYWTATTRNPPCACNPWTTCPLPSAMNRLSVRVDAGEKRCFGEATSAAAVLRK